MSSEIRDINLAESGEQKIEWVKRNCDLLRTLKKNFPKQSLLQERRSPFPYIWKQRLHICARFWQQAVQKCM